MTEALEQIPDAELISAVRSGEVSAFGVLYERHLVAAKRAAACLANTPSEREDLVAEAFTRVLRMLRDGRGPNEEFRPYLLVTLRNTAINATTRGAPVSLYADVPEVSPADAADDPVIDRWHATVAADAFASLPERWRVVLWHTEVENESPATVAPLLGMRPNSVAALAYRAREGLRQAYLRMHVPEEPRRECRSTVHKLAGYVRHSLPLPLSRKIDKHLTGCADCRRRVSALRSVNDELRGLLGPVVLGTALAAAYLPAPAAVSGAVTGALSGAAGVLTGGATGAGTGTAAGALTGTLAGAVPVLAASDAAAAVSSVLAVKATAVKVVTAVAIAAASTTVSAAAPAGPAPVDAAGVPASTRVPAAGHGGRSLDVAPEVPPTSGTSGRSHAPVSTIESTSATPTTADKAAAKQAKKEAKAAAKSAKKSAKKGDAAQDDGTATKPPKKSKDKKDKKPKKPKKPKKK